MSENLYRVVARATEGDGDTYDSVGTALARTFQLDVTQVAMTLDSDGVEVCQVGSFEEARVYAKRVRDMGANSLVIDPTGKVVEQTGTPRGRTDDLGQTMMGGFQAPDAAETDDGISIGFADDGPTPEPMAPPPPPPPARPDEDLLVLDDSAPAAPSAAPADVAGGEPADSGGTSSGYDNLGDDALVMLDGSTDSAPAKPMSLEHAGTAAAAAASGGDFAPPDEDDALELDETAQSHSPGVSTSEHAPEQAEADTLPPLDSDVGPPETEGEDPSEMDWEPADGEAGPSLARPKPKRPPALPPSAEAPVTAPGWRGAVQRSRSPLELPRELSRELPRLRIIVGFVLAVALGAIAPTCYVSTMESRVQPLLVDLSTAKAHGELLVGMPNYRSPGEIQEEIAGIESRHASYGFIMWLMFSGALGFLWFRFVRAD